MCWAAHAAPRQPTLECDVAIIGSGAGAGITAELLSARGPEGGARRRRPAEVEQRLPPARESEAYPSLYQEAAARKTADKAITILQGRCVGGSTTVNWTSSFRTPSSTLAYWREHFGLTEFTDDAMAPWFLQAEQRLSIGPWLAPPNENNDLLRRGALKLGIAAAGDPAQRRRLLEPRLVRHRLPDQCQAVDAGHDDSGRPRPRRHPAGRDARRAFESRTARSRRCIAWRFSPTAQFERRARDAHRRAALRAGRRRHQHAGAAAALQSARSARASGQAHVPAPGRGLGGLFERWSPSRARRSRSTPIISWRTSTTTARWPTNWRCHRCTRCSSRPLLGGFGQENASHMADLPHTHAMLALAARRLSPGRPAAASSLRGDGTPVLDYPLTDYVLDGLRRAFHSMAEIQFAAGASGCDADARRRAST